MGTVVQLKPKSLVEFEKTALRKIGAVTEMASRIPEMLADLQGTDDHVGGREIAERFVDVLSVLDDAIEALEALAPEAAQSLGSGERQIFELQCELTRLRVTVFASVRCSKLYISDFTLEGLEAAMLELSRTVRGAA